MTNTTDLDDLQDGSATHLLASGWVSRWTTAPDDYDCFGTTTTERCGEWRGRALRRVLCHPDHTSYQEDRYGSGLHASWSQDPRVEDQRAADRIERNRVEREQHEAKRVQGLAWLRSTSDDEIDAAVEADRIESQGLSCVDVRDERKRRATERAHAAHRTAWETCMALVQPAIGGILADDGSPGERGVYGWIKGRDPRVHYSVRVEAHWMHQSDPEHASVLSSNENLGSLACVASWIATGRLRIVAASDVPPEPVVRRIGPARLRAIKHVKIGERDVWVGPGPLALEASGRVVRGKAAAAAIARYIELGGY